jgi:GntR family transcriptional regulator, carbon starvation induced regulator
VKRAVAVALPSYSPGDAPRTVADAVHGRLRADLMGGRYAPGEALRLEPLMARYGCGISPLREALNRLAADRLVRAVGQRGFQAAPVTLAEMWDVMRLRQKLEGEALAMSIETGDARWESEILAAFHRLAKSPPPGHDRADPDAWERSHRDFHGALIAACSSEWLLHFIGILYGHTERYRRIRFERTMPRKLVRDVEAEHRALMDAVLARDKRRAVKLLTEHLDKTANFIAREFAAAESSEAAPRRRARARAAA